MQNETILQYFHWYYNEPDRLWVKLTKEAKICAIWELRCFGYHLQIREVMVDIL